MAERRNPPRKPLPKVDLYYEHSYERGSERRTPPRGPESRSGSRRGENRGNAPRGNSRGGSSRGNTHAPVRKTPPPARRGMTASATIVVALFFGFVVVYMALRAYGFFVPTVDIMTLRLGNMEFQQSVSGMIIRYEEVFHATRDGRVVFDVNEFYRVRSGVAVASIRDVDAVNRNEADRALLQQEIISVHEMRHATQTDPLVERVNSNLQNRMDRSMPHHMTGNLSEVYALLETLSQITDNRNSMIINESVSARNDLYHRHDQLARHLEMNSTNIYATHTGIMSPIIDGFENRGNFTPLNMRELSREEVRMSVDHEAIIPGREVEAGDGVFKIVDNTWYVASWMPNEMVHGFTVGQNRTIFLENTLTGRFEPIPMRIYYMRDAHRDTLVIFRSTRYVAEFLHQRNVNVRITDNVQNGFMIPASAIATRRFLRIPTTHLHGFDEQYFVMHLRDEGLQPIPTHIYKREPYYVYVLEETLTLGQGDILSPVQLGGMHHVISDADMLIERGIFRTNLNYAYFTIVNIEGEMPEAGGQILLDPARNPTIRQFDSIVVDAATVRHRQVVR